MGEYTPFKGRRREQPAPVLVERVWRLQSKSGKVLSCGLYLHPHGIEARCGYRDEADLLMSMVLPDDGAAKAMAEEWRQHSLSQGFSEVN